MGIAIVRTITCYSCGITFGLTDDLYELRRRDHRTFHCPNGHGQHFLGKTDEEKRIEQLERVRARLLEDAGSLCDLREQLIAALRECPIPGCEWRSRKQIPRQDRHDASVAAGIERVRHDLLEHFVRDHATQAVENPRQLAA